MQSFTFLSICFLFWDINFHNARTSDWQLYNLHFLDKIHCWKKVEILFFSIVCFPLQHQIRYRYFLALKLVTYCDLMSCYKVSPKPTVHFMQLLFELLFRRINLVINIILIVPFPEALKTLAFPSRAWLLPLTLSKTAQCTRGIHTGGSPWL